MRSFDGVALHPYAEDAAALEAMTEGLRNVILENHDPGTRLKPKPAWHTFVGISGGRARP